MTATSPGGTGGKRAPPHCAACLGHGQHPAHKRSQQLSSQGTGWPLYQAKRCPSILDSIICTNTKRKNRPSVSQKNHFWQFVRSAWESSLPATQGERGLSTRELYLEPALSLCSASSCTLRGKRSPPLPHRKPAVGRCHPVSGRGNTAAGVGLWGAEPVDCPPLTLPTFPSKESTSAWL